MWRAFPTPPTFLLRWLNLTVERTVGMNLAFAILWLALLSLTVITPVLTGMLSWHHRKVHQKVSMLGWIFTALWLTLLVFATCDYILFPPSYLHPFFNLVFGILFFSLLALVLMSPVVTGLLSRYHHKVHPKLSLLGWLFTGIWLALFAYAVLLYLIFPPSCCFAA